MQKAYTTLPNRTEGGLGGHCNLDDPQVKTFQPGQGNARSDLSTKLASRK
jgi:hypothetical protein